MRLQRLLVDLSDRWLKNGALSSHESSIPRMTIIILRMDITSDLLCFRISRHFLRMARGAVAHFRFEQLYSRTSRKRLVTPPIASFELSVMPVVLAASARSQEGGVTEPSPRELNHRWVIDRTLRNRRTMFCCRCLLMTLSSCSVKAKSGFFFSD